MKKIYLSICFLAIVSFAKAQDAFIGEIRIFAGTFAPRGWAFCSGQLLPISQNTALFSILGTTYGGNGKSNFALPNLNGRVPIGAGQGPGLSIRDLGETGGESAVTLTESELPSHRHSVTTSGSVSLPAFNAVGNVDTPAGSYSANSTKAYSASYDVEMKTAGSEIELAPAGSSMPHNNLQPYLVIRYIIALQGVFPPRQ